MIRFRAFFAVCGLLVVAGCGQNQGPPFSPEDALSTFELPEGFRLELVVSEPLINDPVDMAFDADGNLYVVEMPDYPTDDVKGPFSRIRKVVDSDGDGQYDSSTVFTEEMPFVNGVMPWGNGILVTKAPDILYFEDTTGDGVADVRRVVLTGFAVTNPQLRVSSLRYGLDNWIYGAYSRASAGRGFPEHADTGHPLTFPDSPEADSVNISPGTNFRFRPDEFLVEPAGGMSQFGLSMDAEGNRFAVWNNDHIRQIVIDHRYTERNPWFSISSEMASIAVHGGAPSIYPITEGGMELHESEIGHITSACGNSIYTGDLFQSEYSGASFVCEPANNLVHADLLSADGATWRAERAQQEAEFLASTDSWFRPVNSMVGPDGALYVVDMYRKLIEHPAWIPHKDEDGYHTHAGTLQLEDFHEGQGLGRIWRVVPEDYDSDRPGHPELSSAGVEELVRHLSHPVMWWRLNAQRLLVSKSDQSAVPYLEELLESASTAHAKNHALWTLEGLGSLDKTHLLAALGDEHASVRKQAVILSEPRLESGQIVETLLEMAGDSDDHVQFQVALTLSALPGNQTFEPLQPLAMEHIGDSWFRAAVLLNASDNALAWFRRELDGSGPGGSLEGRGEFLNGLASIVGARSRVDEISAAVASIHRAGEGAAAGDLLVQQASDSSSQSADAASGGVASLQQAALEGLVAGLNRAGGVIRLSGDGQNHLLGLATGAAPGVRRAALDVANLVDIAPTPTLRRVVDRALENVMDEEVDVEERTLAAGVIGIDTEGLRLELFDQLLRPDQPAGLQAEAARILLRSDDPGAVNLLIDRWNSYTSTIRGIVESGVLGRRNFSAALIGALEAGEIEPSSLNRSSRNRLSRHSDPELRERATALFSDMSDDSRDELISEYFEATTRNGDIENGRAVFESTCSICHQAGGDLGYAVGPDIESIAGQTRVNLLTKIIKPNDFVTAGYDGYIVETTDGQTVSGVMVQESSHSVTLRAPGGIEHTIQRDNLQMARPMGYSIMPEGLESTMSVQDMADLFEFIKNLE